MGYPVVFIAIHEYYSAWSISSILLPMEVRWLRDRVIRPHHSSELTSAGLYVENTNELLKKLPGLKTWQPVYVILYLSYLSASTSWKHSSEGGEMSVSFALTAVGRGYRRREWSYSDNVGCILIVKGLRCAWSRIVCTSCGKDKELEFPRTKNSSQNASNPHC